MENIRTNINITVILGSLKSGKTAFFKNFLKKNNNNKIAIIVSEFGKLNIDGKLFKDFSYSKKEATDGSIFCSCRFDKLLETLEELIDNRYTNILIESNGLANPISMTQLFNYLSERKKVELKITTVGIDDSSIPSPCCNVDLDNSNFKFNKKDFLLNNKILTLKKLILSLDDENIKDIMNILAEVKNKVYRLKGFVKAKEGIFFIDGTGPTLIINSSNFQGKKGIVILYFDSEELKEFIKKFSKNILIQ